MVVGNSGHVITEDYRPDGQLVEGSSDLADFAL